MDALRHNFIAEMTGPEFLVFYGIALTLTVVACRWRIRLADPSATLPPAPIPAAPDPYEIAYLRGSRNELLRVILFTLVQKGYLRPTDDKKRIERADSLPDPGDLSEMERCVYGHFTKPLAPGDLFQGLLPERLGKLARPLEGRLIAEGLLTSPDTRDRARAVGWTGASVLLLGLYKFLIALEKGRGNVLFLVALSALTAVVLVVACRVPRLSVRGRDYLSRLQLAFGGLKRNVARPSAVAAPPTDAARPADAARPSDTLPGTKPALLLLVGIFGAGVLADTAYAFVPELFPRSGARADSGGGGSCGGGCGVSGGSCGSGGCGGGGGGCGGCGGD